MVRVSVSQQHNPMQWFTTEYSQSSARLIVSYIVLTNKLQEWEKGVNKLTTTWLWIYCSSTFHGNLYFLHQSTSYNIVNNKATVILRLYL